MDDAALVALARGGDLAATETLLARHQNGAYTAALRLLGEPADAEDVAQDALVRAYGRLDDLAQGAQFGAWLRKIAVNLSLNVLRRRDRLRFESLEDAGSRGDGRREAAEFVDEREPTPEAAVIDGALRERIDELVRRLPDEQRVAVVLRDMYGYDVAEVAELQRCGLSAAKMRISRGRAALKEMIERSGGTGTEVLA